MKPENITHMNSSFEYNQTTQMGKAAAMLKSLQDQDIDNNYKE